MAAYCSVEPMTQLHDVAVSSAISRQPAPRTPECPIRELPDEGFARQIEVHDGDKLKRGASIPPLDPEQAQDLMLTEDDLAQVAGGISKDIFDYFAESTEPRDKPD
jgi:hypothetical protein